MGTFLLVELNELDNRKIKWGNDRQQENNFVFIFDSTLALVSTNCWEQKLYKER